MQNEYLPSATLSEFYRFALLLTGNLATAEKVVTETLVEVEGRLAELRHEHHRHSWLATRIRQRCIHETVVNTQEIPRLLRTEDDDGEPGEVLEIEAFIMAQRFSTLPEPERSALALFYLNLFSSEEIAKLLKMELEDLSELLARGRELLQQSLNPAS